MEETDYLAQLKTQEALQYDELKTVISKFREYCDENHTLKQIAGELASACELTVDEVLEDWYAARKPLVKANQKILENVLIQPSSL